MEDQTVQTRALAGKDVAALTADLQAIARQQSLQIDIVVEMSKLIAKMVQTQMAQGALLDASGANKA